MDNSEPKSLADCLRFSSEWTNSSIVLTTLDIIAESKTQVLVVYDSDVNYHQDGSYETKKEYCGLISKEDLYKGNHNFTEIKMINNVIDVIYKGGR